MNSINRILIPFDFSKVAQCALDYALKFCRDIDRIEILLCYVANDTNYNSKQEEMTYYIENTSLPGYVTIKGKVIKGDFVDALLKEQLNFKADIIIMGTKGAEIASEKAISNTSQITLGVHCPVIVIPFDYQEFKIENITLAVGNDEIDDPTVLITLLVIARQFNAKIHVLTLYGEDDDAYFSESKNEATLKYYFEKYYSFSSSARSIKMADSIFKYDEQHGIDMLAIIPRNHAKNVSPSKGALTSFLTMKTEIPLLTMNN